MKKLAKEQIIKMAEDEFGARFATNPIYRGLRRALTDFKTIQMSWSTTGCTIYYKTGCSKSNWECNKQI